jgi:hypothetical protein
MPDCFSTAKANSTIAVKMARSTARRAIDESPNNHRVPASIHSMAGGLVSNTPR